MATGFEKGKEQKGIAEITLLFILMILAIGGVWYYTKSNQSTTEVATTIPSPTPPDTTIDYEKLRTTQFELPSNIPLHENAAIEEKFVGYDKDSHKIYRANISHTGLVNKDIYTYYKSVLVADGWTVLNEDTKFCEDSLYYCPEWINLTTSKGQMTLKIFYIDTLGYFQWHDTDITNVILSFKAPLNANVFPGEFIPEIVLVQTERPYALIYLEMYSPLITQPENHEKLFTQNGYSRCAIGSAPVKLVYTCSTENEDERYSVLIIGSETYTFDIVTIGYTNGGRSVAL